MDLLAPRPPDDLDTNRRDFYLCALSAMERLGVPYVVGGAFSMRHYAGIMRDTKDLDLFIRPGDCLRALDALAAAGYRTELTNPQWIGKAFNGGDFVDLIFRSANGLCTVDDEWLAHAVEGEVLGQRAPICPVEEMIWSKSYLMERDRFDGADINHLILARGSEMDWRRLLERFALHERLLLGHVIFFGYIYPSERWRVPEWVLEELLQRMRTEPPVGDRICRGPLVSRELYQIDIDSGGFKGMHGQ